MSKYRFPIAAAAVAACFLLTGALACSPAVSADAPVVTYYYIPG